MAQLPPAGIVQPCSVLAAAARTREKGQSFGLSPKSLSLVPESLGGPVGPQLPLWWLLALSRAASNGGSLYLRD